MKPLIFCLALAGFALGLAGPAMADGKSGSGLQVNAPSPLNTQAPVQPPLYAHAGQPVHECHAHCHDPCTHDAPDQRLDNLTLDVATLGSMTGGVGAGLSDVFVGGGRFFGAGNGAVSSNGRAFGTRARGGFVRRNIALSRAVAGY